MRPRRRPPAGFTLIEMVVVITLSGILATVVWRSVSEPLQGFVDTARRTRLVDAAHSALERMTREIRLALPNSVRLAPGGQAVEFLRTRTGGRYRATADPANPGSDALDFTLAADEFDVLGPLQEFGGIRAGPGGLAACLGGAIDCLVVFNTGQPSDCNAALAPRRTNAYCGDNTAGVASADSGARRIGFDRNDSAPPAPLPLRSPGQRFHIVDTAVMFVCDSGAQALTRYAGYAISAGMVVPPGGVGNLVADRIVACSFGYDPGSATRAGLVTLRITLADDDAPSETVTLLQQVHVANVP